MSDPLTENTTLYVIATAVFAFILVALTFGLGFALEESYPNWPLNPGRRELPGTASVATGAAILWMLTAIFKRRWRRWAIGGFAAAIAINFGAFYFELQTS